ncbi:MAG: hypothetical protein A2X64_11340 [Ignavibacteria bacterium GWF2_33_9]|nr:MAG: hypothetical protein A2X64_11340 [Ignavibacteria bacterium GWF2_33_9]
MKKYLLIFIILLQGSALFAEWESINNGIEGISPSIFSLQMIDSTIYAGTALSQHTGQGLYSTTDFGKTWQYLGLKNEIINATAKIKENLIVSTNNNGIYFSSDNGKSWEKSNVGLPYEDTEHFFVKSIVSIGDTLFILSQAPTIKGTSIYFSTDYGKKWNEVPNYPEIYAEYLFSTGKNLIIVGHDDCIVMGYCSLDRGETWEESDINVNYDYVPNMIKLKDELFYTCGDSYIYISEDDGLTWNYKEYDMDIHFVSINSYKDTLFAVTSKGLIYFSFDFGNSFYKRNDKSKLYNKTIKNAIITDKVMAQFHYYDKEYGLMQDMDNKWSNSIMDAKVPSNIYSINRFSGNLVIQSSSGLFISKDKGDNWQKITNYPYYPINFVTTIYDNTIAMILGQTISTSEDAGENWEHNSINIPSSINSFDFNDNLYLIASYNHGFYYSRDYGETWEMLPNAKYSPDNHQIFQFKNKIFTYSKYIGLSSTDDFGENWKEILSSTYHTFNSITKNDNSLFIYWIYSNEIVKEPTPVINYSIDGEKMNFVNISYKTYMNNNNYSLSCFRVIQDKLFIGPKSGGLFYTSDYGEKWTDTSIMIENQIINDCVNLFDYMFIATSNGVYRNKLTEFGLGVGEQDNNPEISLYPNPTTDYITIDLSNYTLKGVVDGQAIRIFDVLGNEVLTNAIENSVETQNFVSLQKIDVSALPPGVYFVKVGDVVQKFIKL